jgi:hypothetical protein
VYLRNAGRKKNIVRYAVYKLAVFTCGKPGAWQVL